MRAGFLSVLSASFAVLQVCAYAAERIELPDLAADITDGRITRLQNRLTGELLDFEVGARNPGLVWHGDTRFAPVERRDPGPEAENALVYSWELAAGEQIRTRIGADAEAGELTIRQEGQAERPGLYGVRWGLDAMDAKQARIIVPGHSGVAFGERPPFTTMSFSWPTSWEAGMVLLQMERGGFLVWARDMDMTFKALHLRYSGHRYAITFESRNHAPLEGLTTIDSVDWRVRAYRGDWREGARIYRDWLVRRFRPVPLAQQRPEWVRDIRALVIADMDVGKLDLLTRHVVPERTILYVPQWRRDRYDVNYPEYDADPAFGPWIEAAHARGFRVMVHVNYFGCDIRHPLYEQFEPVHLRSPHTGEKLHWVPPLQRTADDEEPTIKFAYLHPGSAAWRQLLVERFAAAVARYGIDSLHLDQTLCIVNHAHGRVDGMTVAEGNLALHRELRVAMPRVALSGEGLNEVTLAHEAFAQRHAAYAVDHVHKTWNEDYIRCAHPVSSYLFLPYCIINGYLGLSNPASQGVYGGWTRAYANWGVIPTFSHPSQRQLESPEGEAAVLFDLMGLWTRHRLYPVLDGPWPDSLVFRHRGNGAEAAVLRHDHGMQFQVAAAGVRRELFRYVQGVSTLAAPGRIPGWICYNRDSILGLDPSRTYLYLPEPRDVSRPHISALDDGVTVRAYRHRDGQTVVDLASTDAGAWRRLHHEVADAETYVLTGSRRRDLERGASFHADVTVCGGERRAAIFAHPPWKQDPERPDAPLGVTVGAFSLTLPAQPRAELTFAIGLRDGVASRSDGVTFSIEVNGEELFSEHWQESAWREHQLDLSAFAGHTVKLAFITHQGPDGNPAFDWAAWGQPIIRLRQPDRPHDLVFTAPRQHRILTHRSARSTVSEADGGMIDHHLTATLPLSVVFTTHEPASVALPCRLSELPFTVSATVDGQSQAELPRYAGFGPGNGTSAGDVRTGFSAHPPNGGRTYADFLIRLPRIGAMTLAFAVALQDDSESDACGFLVQVNGETRYHEVLRGPDGWHEGAVDLSDMAGQTVLLSLAVDSEGAYVYDWARWDAPTIVGR